MTTPEAAEKLYKETVVIDCLNVSNWERPRLCSRACTLGA